jgi:tetratricopeptide (TPR) repeat protein
MTFRTIYMKIMVPLLAVVLLLTSCSSAPKRPAEIYTERNTAYNLLELAGRTANQGRYADALLILEDVRRTAVGVDDSPLLVRTAVTRGNVLFSLGRHDEAFLEWEAARKEAESSGENDLAAFAAIYSCRGRLVLLINSGTNIGVEEIRDQVNRLISSIKTNREAQASGFLVLGMAEKELGRYAEAERALRSAIAIHEKDLYLEEAAYDWYFLASIFSVSGRYDNALAALTTAISFDRRAENGFGLASSWQAMGEVYLKKSLSVNPAEAGAVRAEAVQAFRRAADIFRANFLEDAALKAEEKADALGL